jgi:hypothetical protein
VRLEFREILGVDAIAEATRSLSGTRAGTITGV